MKKQRGRLTHRRKILAKKSLRQLRSSWLMFVIMAIILTVVGLWSAHSQASKTAKKTTKAQIIITAAGFNPQSLNTKAGTQITWVNYDTKPHQVIADSTDGSPVLGFDNDLILRTGDSYSFTFIHPGTYSYHDQLSPELTPGSIMVQ